MPGAPDSHKIRVASRTIITKDFYEIALVLDNSGSMAASAGGPSKMESAKAAAKELVTLMHGNPLAKQRTTISLVPFTLSVDVGQQYRYESWMDLQGKFSVHWQNTDFSQSARKPESKWKLFDELGVPWGGCVESRPGDLGTDDISSPSNDGLFVPQFAPDEPGGRGASSYTYTGSNNRNYSIAYPNSFLEDNSASCPTNPPLGKDGSDATLKTRQERLCKHRNRPSVTTASGRGPNFMCDARPLTRLTKIDTDTVPDALDDRIDAMRAEGNTKFLERFVWGWRTLSPNGPFANGESYSKKDNRKYLILMTDGMNAWNAQSNHNKSRYSPFGYYHQNRLPDPGNPAAAPTDAN